MSKKQSYEYYAGRDSVLNGANTTNCNFSIFSTPEKLKEWERGRDSVKRRIKR